MKFCEHCIFEFSPKLPVARLVDELNAHWHSPLEFQLNEQCTWCRVFVPLFSFEGSIEELLSSLVSLARAILERSTGDAYYFTNGVPSHFPFDDKDTFDMPVDGIVTNYPDGYVGKRYRMIREACSSVGWVVLNPPPSVSIILACWVRMNLRF